MGVEQNEIKKSTDQLNVGEHEHGGDKVNPSHPEVYVNMNNIPSEGHKQGEISVFCKDRMMCIYPSSGLPAHVPSGCNPDEVPALYLTNFKKDSERKWLETQKYRKDNEIYKICAVPHAHHFDLIKDAYVHCLHGVSRNGQSVIIYEKTGAGLTGLKNLLQEGKLQKADLLHHYCYLWEYTMNVVFDHEELRNYQHKSAIVVMDFHDFSMSSFNRDVMSYLKSASELGSDHYPSNIAKVYIINAPSWLAGVWNVIKNILPKSVQKSTKIYGSKYIDKLRKDIKDDQIPHEFGGSSHFNLGHHPFELALRALHKRTNEAASVELY